MKIAVPAEGSTLSSKADSRFGRAAGFVVYDDKTKDVTYVENTQNLQAVQGAGIQSAKNILEAQIDIVLTAHVGPKAFTVLQQAGVKVYTGIEGTVQNALDAYEEKRLKFADNADVDAHW